MYQATSALKGETPCFTAPISSLSRCRLAGFVNHASLKSRSISEAILGMRINEGVSAALSAYN